MKIVMQREMKTCQLQSINGMIGIVWAWKVRNDEQPHANLITSNDLGRQV